MKKITLLVGLLLVLSAVFVSARGGVEPKPPPPEPPAVSAPGVFPIVDQKVTLKFLTPIEPLIKSYEYGENYMTTHMVDLTNVEMEWDFLPSDQTVPKLMLVIASQDFPDVYLAGPKDAPLFGTNQQLARSSELVYGSEGIFTPLNDLIDKQGFNVKKIFEEYPDVEGLITAPDGNIYSLFNIGFCYHCTMAMKMWVNHVWLKELDIPVPETTQDFYEMLKAFKERDPNKNGIQDEIPLSGSINNWRNEPYNFLMNAFIYNDFDNRLTVENGKVDFAANKPEWRDGLRYVGKLFDEGLIDPAAFTNTTQQEQAIGENPDVVILGASGGGFSGTFVPRPSPQQRQELYDSIPPLTGPNGLKVTSYQNPKPATGRFYISSTCEYPEIAFKWGDARLDMDESISLMYGIRGKGWKYAEPGEVGVFGQKAYWQDIKPDLKPDKEWKAITWSWAGPMNTPGSIIHEAHVSDPNWMDERYTPANLGNFLTVETKNNYEPYIAKEYFPGGLWMPQEIADELAPMITTIKSYIEESAARFITGQMDIESDWDSYVQELEKMGIDRYVELFQQMYDQSGK